MGALDELRKRLQQKSSTQLTVGNTEGASALEKLSARIEPLSEEQARIDIEEGIDDTTLAKRIDENTAHINTLVDKSISMGGTEGIITSNLNLFHANQAKDAYDTQISLTLFADKAFPIIIGQSSKKHFELKPYKVSGYGTALYDSIVYASREIEKCEPAKHIIHLIITDGEDNTGKPVDEAKKLITDKRSKGEHFFLLSNGYPDAKTLARRLGIDVEFAADFSAAGDGFRIVFDSIERVLWQLRTRGAVNRDWADNIDAHKQNPRLPYDEVKLLTCGRSDGR